MKTEPDYQILKDTDSEGLEKQVNLELKNGYKLVGQPFTGGVETDGEETAIVFCQAVIGEKPAEPVK